MAAQNEESGFRSANPLGPHLGPPHKKRPHVFVLTCARSGLTAVALVVVVVAIVVCCCCFSMSRRLWTRLGRSVSVS